MAGSKAGGARLSDTVESTLEARIRAGAPAPGERLPTEQQIGAEFGVSRTVVREAVARLRARGMVEARQGSGLFVAAADPHGLAGRDRIPAVLDVLELRMAVEIEAAALAARRRSPAQDMRIREAARDMGLAIERGEQATDADFAFHHAVAEATNNRVFVEFLDGLGARTIPRAHLGPPAAPDQDYLRKVQAEHVAVMRAIAEQDADAAREAMRAHLQESQRRYRAFLPP